MKKLSIALAVTAALSSSAFAYQAGDIIVRGGLVAVNPEVSSTGLDVVALSTGELAGTGVDVDNNVQIGLAATYMFDQQLGLEVLGATPFTHNITANLGTLGTVNAGETQHLPPTISAVYYPMGSDANFAPYIGAGVNITVFFDSDVSPELEAGLAGVADAIAGTEVGLPSPTPLSLELESSVGLALQAGFDYKLADNMHLNAVVRWVDIETEASITNDDMGEIIHIDNITLDPWVYQINIGYTF